MKINFALYILNILLEKGHVTIPGFGKFNLVQNPASFGDDRKTLLPPNKDILFTEVFDEQDLGLKEALIKEENISLDQAESLIQNFTKKTLDALLTQKEVELAYIGTLRQKSQDELSFIANPKTLLHLNGALPELELPSLSKVRKPLATVQTVAASSTAALVGQEGSTSTKTDTTMRVQEEESKSLWRWILPILLVGAGIATVVLGMKACGGEKAEVYQTKEEVVVDTTADEEKPIETEKEDVEEIDYAEKEDVVEDVIDEPVYDPSKVTSEDFAKGECIVIIGAFASDQNISTAKTKVSKAGYAVYTETHGPFTRVGMFVDCAEVGGQYKQFIDRLIDKLNIESAYFLEPKVHTGN